MGGARQQQDRRQDPCDRASDRAAARDHRPCRSPADAAGNAGVPVRQDARPPRTAGGPSADEPRLRRLFRQQVERRAAQQAAVEQGRRQTHLRVPRLDPRQPEQELAVRPVRPRHPDRAGRGSGEPAGRLVPRGQGRVLAGRGQRPAVPGHAPRLRPLPPPPAGEVEPAGLLRLRSVLRPRGLQGSAQTGGQKGAETEGREGARSGTWSGATPRKSSRPWRPTSWRARRS